MTEFEHNMILMMKCLNKRMSEIVEQLHEMNGHTESFYMSKDEENVAEDDE